MSERIGTHQSDKVQEEAFDDLVEEITDKLQDREPVDIEQYAERYPPYADRLRQLLPTLQAMATFDLGKSSQAMSALPTLGEQRTLGDFLIKTEIARGGMGVVYEAEQISLGRRIALKVLPFAPILDKTQLARFKNEARAAASLDHPNVVSVFSVGSERGVHYYAMQFIEGQTVAEGIGEERRQRGLDEADESLGQEPTAPVASGSSSEDPTELFVSSGDQPRSQSEALKDTNAAISPTGTIRDGTDEKARIRRVVELVVQAAEALEHAHRMGIVHRDVKPSNLLVDAEHHLWVADFGLAMVEAEGNLTTSGSMLGTLRYMSPEQMRGDRRVLDHRTDIYSLGVTLYEMLTLQPAFPDSDAARLAQRIPNDDPPPPCRVNPAIPRDLATIVMKAMAKEPKYRYTTAGALAEDLRNFLENKPIRARRPSLVDRARKWTRRHRAIVGTAVVTIAAAFAIGGGLLWGERSRTLAALARETNQRHAAEQQKQIAEEQEKQVRIKEREATSQRDAALLNQYHAEIVSGQADWERGHLARLHRKLMGHLPIVGEPDRRGWEWYYLVSLCHPERQAMYSSSWGHSATWSPDGEYVALGGCIWRAESGEIVRRFVPSRAMQTGGDWSPDGQHFAWGAKADDSCIYIWDRQTDEVSELRGHATSVWCVAWGPDGERLASGSPDGTVRIWDTGTSSTSKALSLDGNVRDVVWSPNGKLLAAVGGDCLKIWKSTTGELVANHKSFGARWSGNEGAISWHPDGRQLAVTNGETWLLLRAPDWTIQRQREIPTARGHDIAWSPDGQTIALAQNDVVEIWEPFGQEPVRTLSGHLGPVSAVAWSPDGKQLLTSDGSEIKIWDLGSPLQPPVFSTGGGIQSVAWLPDSETLALADSDGGSTSFWNAADGSQIKVQRAVIDGELHWSPHRQLVAQSSDSERGPIVQILDAADGSVHSVWRGEAGHRLGPRSWSQDGSKMAIGTTLEGKITLELWDVDREMPISRWTQTGIFGPIDGLLAYESNKIVWSQDGTRVAVRIRQGLVYVVDVTQGITTLKHKLGGYSYSPHVTSVAFSPDGRAFAAGSSEGLLEVVAVDSGHTLSSVQAHNAMITALAWSPDGRRIVSGAQDHSVKVLTSDGECADLLSFTLEGSTVFDGARHLAWSPDGKRLAAATDLGRVCVWDASRGCDLAEPGRRRGELAWAYYLAPRRDTPQANRARLGEVLKTAPNTADFWRLRGQASAELGDFHRASEEFAKAVQPGLRRSFDVALDYGYSLLASGEFETYRQHCVSLVDAFADTKVPSNGESVAWLCALVPNNDLDSETLVRLARGSADRVTLESAATLYRSRRYEEAAGVLTDSAAKLGRSSDTATRSDLALSLYFLAMARHQLGHWFQASRLLDNATTIAEEISPYSTWSVRVLLEVLEQEANALIRK